MPDDLRERFYRAQERLKQERFGGKVKTAEVMRALIIRGLDSLENERRVS
jgi:hypothetical protein